MPLRAFAARYGLKKDTVMRIEHCDQNVTINTLEDICRAFNCDIGDLFPRQ